MKSTSRLIRIFVISLMLSVFVWVWFTFSFLRREIIVNSCDKCCQNDRKTEKSVMKFEQSLIKSFFDHVQQSYIAMDDIESTSLIQFLFLTWHISLSTRISKSIPVPFVDLLANCLIANSTSLLVQVEGMQTPQLIVKKRGTRWPG